MSFSFAKNLNPKIPKIRIGAEVWLKDNNIVAINRINLFVEKRKKIVKKTDNGSANPIHLFKI